MLDRLGVFSSATLKTVQHGLAAIHGHLRDRGLTRTFEVVLHRGHCRPATVSPQALCLCICVYNVCTGSWKGEMQSILPCRSSGRENAWHCLAAGRVHWPQAHAWALEAAKSPLRIFLLLQERIAAGGEEHDTIKPLAEHLGGDAQNVVLVDDEAWKAAPDERGRLLLVPSWDTAGADAGAGDRVRPLIPNPIP